MLFTYILLRNYNLITSTMPFPFNRGCMIQLREEESCFLTLKCMFWKIKTLNSPHLQNKYDVSLKKEACLGRKYYCVKYLQNSP